MGFILMISGMGIVLAALVLLAGLTQRLAFVLTGIAIEFLGLGLLALGYKSLQAVRPKAGRWDSK
jgi:Na+-transporting NADH:ubiquinone oxidoreductase subunit NqrE